MIILSLGIGITFAGHKAMSSLPIKSYFENERTNAVWEWRNVNSIVNEAEDNGAFLSKHQINTIYLDVSGESRQPKHDNLEKYISTMHAYKIRVIASGGDKYWSQPDKRQEPVALMDFVFDYNNNYPQSKFSGVEYDIESYNQDGFEKGSDLKKDMVLSEYLDTVDTLASHFTDKLKANPDPSMELGFAVPYWFDNQNENIKSVNWKEKTGPVIYHVLDRLNSVQKSNVVVMAYRNASRGNNGTIALARTEVQYAQYKASNVKVIIGQETTNVEPEKITFFNKTKTEMSTEVKWIDEQFGSVPTYGGVAINDFVGYYEMAD